MLIPTAIITSSYIAYRAILNGAVRKAQFYENCTKAKCHAPSSLTTAVPLLSNPARPALPTICINVPISILGGHFQLHDTLTCLSSQQGMPANLHPWLRWKLRKGRRELINFVFIYLKAEESSADESFFYCPAVACIKSSVVIGDSS